MTDWTMEISSRNKGADRFVNDWVVEKLAKVVDGVARASDINSYDEEFPLRDELYSAYRNACKLACWLAGNASLYPEEETWEAFQGGETAMKRHFEELLAPILEAKAGRK